MNAAVLGGGSWGTALAAHLARSGHRTRLWLRREDIARGINEQARNPDYLPGVKLPTTLSATTAFATALEDAATVFVVIPSPSCREVYARLREQTSSGTALVSATKGIELHSLKRMSEVAAEELPGWPFVALSGPSFALEVAREQPTVVVLASADEAVAARVQHELSGRTLRAYTSSDVVGVELAGALKNVIAIAAGILDGLGYGHNIAAALMTRGLAEIGRLAEALGGRPDTLAGLAGLGDLVLTCTGALSRNRRLGVALGKGLTLEQALAEMTMVAEGVGTARAACDLAQRVGVELPIAEQMRAVLYEQRSPRAAVEQLMLRRLRSE